MFLIKYISLFLIIFLAEFIYGIRKGNIIYFVYKDILLRADKFYAFHIEETNKKNEINLFYQGQMVPYKEIEEMKKSPKRLYLYYKKKYYLPVNQYLLEYIDNYSYNSSIQNRIVMYRNTSNNKFFLFIEYI